MDKVNLFSLTSKKVADVATFMKENASANTLQYKTEADTTHRLFIPLHKDDDGNMVPYVSTVPVHGWGSGSSFDSCICTKGIKVEGTDFDGSCPVCERLSDASDITKYVKAEKEAACTLVGDARKKFVEELDKEMWKERKVSPAKLKYYVALVQLKCDKDGRALVEGDGSKFDIRIAAWTEKSMEKLLTALTMQDEEPLIGGHEFKIMYGDYKDAMTRVGQATVSVVDDKKMLAREGTPLYKEIMEAMEGFDFDRSIELCRSETKTQTPTEIKVSMNSLFREWDTYKAALAVNPDAKYLEYSTTASTPGAGVTPEAPAAPAGALPTGAQAGTTGGETSLDELDKALGLD